MVKLYPYRRPSRGDVAERMEWGETPRAQGTVMLPRGDKSDTPLPPNLDAVMADYLAGAFTTREAARRLGTSQTKFLKWYHEKRDGLPYSAPTPQPPKPKKTTLTE